ncbi:hypothetical protein Vi05172_g4878 [Venturia inaequalis]|nr:hypothetical protein Vi05172_g4878 [Venturia inaequalis]
MPCMAAFSYTQSTLFAVLPIMLTSIHYPIVSVVGSRYLPNHSR